MIALLSVALALAAGPDDQAAKPPKERKICRSEVETGSIMPTHICHTKAEWEAIDKANAQGVDSFRNHGSSSGRPSDL